MTHCKSRHQDGEKAEPLQLVLSLKLKGPSLHTEHIIAMAWCTQAQSAVTTFGTSNWRDAGSESSNCKCHHGDQAGIKHFNSSSNCCKPNPLCFLHGLLLLCHRSMYTVNGCAAVNLRLLRSVRRRSKCVLVGDFEKKQRY